MHTAHTGTVSDILISCRRSNFENEWLFYVLNLILPANKSFVVGDRLREDTLSQLLSHIFCSGSYSTLPRGDSGKCQTPVRLVCSGRCDVVAAPGLDFVWFFLFSFVTVSGSGWEGQEDAFCHVCLDAAEGLCPPCHPRHDLPFPPAHYRLHETNRPVQPPLGTAIPWH